MDNQGAGLGRPLGARGVRVGVEGPADRDLGAVAAYQVDLERGRDLGHEDLGPVPEGAGGVGDGRAVVAPRGGDDPGGRDGGRQDAVESAARLEGAAVLQEIELEDQRRVEAEGALFQHGDRGLPHAAPDAGRRVFHVLSGDRGLGESARMVRLRHPSSPALRGRGRACGVRRGWRRRRAGRRCRRRARPYRRRSPRRCSRRGAGRGRHRRRRRSG